jgi:hypothetical protein
MSSHTGVSVRGVLVPLLLLTAALSVRPTAQSDPGDLDAFMSRVLARRDDNWKRLQQYVLDESERLELRGPGAVLLYGRERELTWYIREGVFVRSPVAVDGAAVAESERLQYENEWLAREKHRDADERRDQADSPSPGAGGPPVAGADGSTLARLVREPRFVSSAYFLKFKFEPGRYAFAGPEQVDGHRVLRIEYYPTQLYGDDRDRGGPPDTGTPSKAQEQESRLQRQMNKVALVTLWVEPGAHQIVRYTFENIGWDFLPGRSLARIEDVSATMEMGQPFAGVWLPREIRGRGAVTLANGTYEVRYRTSYHDYREADVKVRIR